MSHELNCRVLLQSLGIGLAGLDLLASAKWAFAAGKDELTIGWPVDVPTWDPVERTIPDAQPIYKLVFDQPLDQAPDLSLTPKLVSAWKMADDALSLALEFRDDVTFHDGSKMTTEDFRYTYIERVRAGEKIDVGAVWVIWRTSKSCRRPRPSCISTRLCRPRRHGSRFSPIMSFPRST